MSGIAHFVNFILTLLIGGFRLPIWVVAALICASSNRKRELRMRQEELSLLRKIANQGEIK